MYCIVQWYLPSPVDRETVKKMENGKWKMVYGACMDAMLPPTVTDNEL